TVRNQYLDVDDRLNTLEGGGTGEAAGATAPQAAAPAPTPRTAAPASAPAAVSDSAPAVFGDAGLLANTADERSAYEAAFAVLRGGDYQGATGMFNEFLRLYPTGAYAPNATYWLGESYY